MKRLITLALVLVMALSLAAPAMAFTGIAATTSDAKPELAIKLVDLSEGFVTVNFNAPPTNRGYVKNEVVCAVVSMQVPKDYSFENDVLEFSGVNVSLWQDDNFYAHGTTVTNQGGGIGTLRYTSNNVSPTTDSFSYATNMAADNYIRYNGLSDLSDEPAQTYHFAIFGRVLADGAKMNATLKGDGRLANVYNTGSTTGVGVTGALHANDYFSFTPIKDDYRVGYFDPTRDRSAVSPTNTVQVQTEYATTNNVAATLLKAEADEILYVVELTRNVGTIPLGAAFAVVTDKNYKCERLYVSMNPGTASWSRVYDGNMSNDSIKADFWGGTYIQFQKENFTGANKVVELATSSEAAQLMIFLDKVVNGVFGIDIRGVGNTLKPDWWFGNESQTVEVEIEPWYAEVTVPPEIEIDIPKTGDAMSVLGFVLIALAGLAVVAVRKVRA